LIYRYKMTYIAA